MNAPNVTRLPGLPERVHIYEVGPRDGLQNESVVVPVEAKATLVEKIPTKSGAPSPLGGQSPVDESRTAFAS